MTETVIETEGLTKRYGNEIAVKDLDLSIESGEVYGFLGPNGAGKTTTIRMLNTLTNPTEGTGFIAGNEITEKANVIDKIGYLPEEPPVYEELSGMEHLEYIADLRDVQENKAKNRIDEYLDRLNLTKDADRRIEEYSKGMRQKTALIQTVIHEPDVIFLDEPVSGLDPRAAKTVKDVIKELAEKETTIFLSSHILPVVDELADTVGVLYEGELVAEGKPNELKRKAEEEERSLEDVFLEVTQENVTEEKPGNMTEKHEKI